MAHSHLTNNSDALFSGKGPGLVYLIRRSDGLYKIGHTSNIKKRFALAKYENRGYTLSLIHVMSVLCRIEVERSWHGYFADKRISGEWFKLTDADVGLFCSYQGVNAPDAERIMQEFGG